MNSLDKSSPRKENYSKLYFQDTCITFHSLDFRGRFNYAVSWIFHGCTVWTFPGMGIPGQSSIYHLKNNTVDYVFQFYFVPNNYEQFLLSMNAGAPPSQ